MIRLIEDFVVEVDPMNYILERDTGRKDKDTGRPIMKPISYHQSLEKAVDACRQEYVRRGLQNVSISLSDAVNIFRERDAQFNKLLSQCMRGIQ